MLRFYSWDFGSILNCKIFINEFQIIYECQYSVVSLLIDSGVGLVLSICFVIAVVLNSENNFVIVRLTVWVWCTKMNRQIVYMFTDAC